jgi:hypothetical protein
MFQKTAHPSFTISIPAQNMYSCVQGYKAIPHLSDEELGSNFYHIFR